MDKIKGLLLGFVKPLVLAHIADLGQLAPLLSGVIVKKTNLPQDQANALAADLVNVVEAELVVLINKI